MRFITITEDDIEQGVRDNARYCPLARSLQREFPEMEVLVTACRASIWAYGHHSRSYRLTPKLQQFVNHFDEVGPTWVEPGFYLFDDTPLL